MHKLDIIFLKPSQQHISSWPLTQLGFGIVDVIGEKGVSEDHGEREQADSASRHHLNKDFFYNLRLILNLSLTLYKYKSKYSQSGSTMSK